MKRIGLALLSIILTASVVYTATSWKVTDSEDTNIIGTEILMTENETASDNNWVAINTIKDWVFSLIDTQTKFEAVLFELGSFNLKGVHSNLLFNDGVNYNTLFEPIDPAIAKTDEAETLSANWVNTANPWADNEVSDTLTASLFVGSGSTTTAVDLATAEVAGVLPEANIHADIARDSEVTAAGFTSLQVSDLSDAATPSVLTATETTNKVISNYKSTGTDHVFTFPAPHQHGNVIFQTGDEFQIDLEPTSSGILYLNGTAAAVDEHLVNVSDTLLERIVCYCPYVNGAYIWACYSTDSYAEATP